LCHAHDLITDTGDNLKKLIGGEDKEEDRKGINKKDLLEVGEYQKIIYKYKDGKKKDGKEITIENDPYNSLKTSGDNITDFIKEMYGKVENCLPGVEELSV